MGRKKEILEKVKENEDALFWVEDKYKKDKEVVLEAVKHHGKALMHASDKLRNNKEVVLEAVKQYGEALAFAYELKNDKEVVLEAVKQNGKALMFASGELKNDKEVVLEAIRQYAGSLVYASKELRNNKEVVLEAIKKSGENDMLYISDELRNDKEVILEAMKKNPKNIAIASITLQNEIRNEEKIGKDIDLVKNSIGKEPELSPQMERDVNQDIDKFKNNIAMNTNENDKSNSQEIFNEIQQKFNPKQKAYLELTMIDDMKGSHNMLRYINEVRGLLNGEESTNVHQYMNELRQKHDTINPEGKWWDNPIYEKLLDKIVVKMETSDEFLKDVNPVWNEISEQNLKKQAYMEQKNQVNSLINDILHPKVQTKEGVKEHTLQELTERYNSLNQTQKDYFQKEGVSEAISQVEEVREESLSDEQKEDVKSKITDFLQKMKEEKQSINFSEIWQNTKFTDREEPELSDDLTMDSPKFQNAIQVIEQFKEKPSLLKEISETAWNEVMSNEIVFPERPDWNLILEENGQDRFGAEEAYEKAMKYYQEETQRLDNLFNKNTEIKEKYPNEVKILSNFLNFLESNGEIAPKRYEFLDTITKKLSETKQFDYLKKQLKYLGFGESEQLHKDLEYGIKNAEGKFQIQTTSDKVMKGNKADFTLNFNKSEEGKVFFNSYKATLTTSQGAEREQTFRVQKENNITAKEAINLLEGRAVKIQRNVTDTETGEITQTSDFIKLKLNEEKTEFDNYKIERYGKNYGIDIDQIMQNAKLSFSDDLEMDKVRKHLEKGNITNVVFVQDKKEIKGFAVLNPQWKMLNLYDEKMNRVNSNKIAQITEIEQNQKKNVPQHSHSRGV